jgi:thymidylate synthase (FAD)
MKVTMTGKTEFLAVSAQTAVYDSTGVTYHPEGRGGQDLAEFAGRGCYQSWRKPNPATATNTGYLKHILEVEHESVLEHGSVTFYIEDVSRSLTHEIIRHRHFSYSQLSQRFVVTKTTGEEPVPGVDFIVPPLVREDFVAGEILMSAWKSAHDHYEQLLERAEELADAQGMTGTTRNKAAREVARAVLPNMTPTAIVVTGNHRAWREAILKRANPAADREIRQLFVEIFRQLARQEPNIYQDMGLHNDGTADWVCGGPACPDHH